MQVLLSQLTAWLAPEIDQIVWQGADVTVNGITTDSRADVTGQAFVALHGERFDAHDFVADVAAAGAAVLIVEKPLAQTFVVPVIVVKDTRRALGVIAACWRKQFAIPVVGVTGSNGKTTVKGMIAAIFEAAFGVEHALSTRGNFNNDIGVPLTVFRLDREHKAAVIELGMNHPGEIHVLTQIAQPTIGLINNAQREHQEFMSSVEAVAKENGSVLLDLPASGVGVFPDGDPYTALWKAMAGEHQVLTFGLTETAHIKGEYQVLPFGSEIHVTIAAPTLQTHLVLHLALAGEHNVKNALAAIACAVAAGVDVDAIHRGLEGFVPVNGRLQRKTAQNDACLIDDTYNANPDSVRAAIDVLAKVPSPRILVLGDMGEVGSHGQQFHEEIGQYAYQQGVQHFLGFGELMQYAVTAFNQAGGQNNGKYFTEIDALNQSVEQLMTADATVLIKGSRYMHMERVVKYLEKTHEAEGTH